MGDSVSVKVTLDENVPKLASYPIAVSEDSNVKISALCKGKGKKRKYLLQSDHEGLPFEGHDHSSQNLCKYALGYLDEKTNEIELLPCHHIFVMEKVQRDVDVDILSPISHQQRKASLTEAFGSKKKKRAMRAMESNTISAESISGASSISQLIVSSNETTESPQVSQPSDVMKESAAKSALQAQREIMLPPHDTSATSLSTAYPLSGMVPRNIYHALREWVEAIAVEINGESAADTNSVDSFLSGQNDGWLQRFRQDQSPDFVVEAFSQIFSQYKEKPKDLKKKLGVVLLYNAQLKFCKAIIDCRRQIDKEDLQKLLSFPPSDVFRHITNSFAVYRKSGGKPAFAGTKALT